MKKWVGIIYRQELLFGLQLLVPRIDTRQVCNRISSSNKHLKELLLLILHTSTCDTFNANYPIFTV